ncbi:MAG: peptidoglycan recognition family protein [Chloroflexi bacterium]|nr:peptidoglycan recognition family protein [Chloroflexota bacterium]
MAEWMPGVERIETAAVGGAIVPRGVMSHVMQGWQATMVRWARERPRATPKSAHFTIGRDGRIVQHVPIRRQAWHAGRLDPDAPPRWSLLPPGGNPNDHAVGIEHEGFSGEPWPEPQGEATIRVHRWLFAELGLAASEETVIGHFMTAPASRAADPGPTWPRDRILHALLEAPELDTAALLARADYERAALRAYLGVRAHSYGVREDERWQYIEIRRPKPAAGEV